MSGRVINHLLSNEADVTGIVAARIYPGTAPPGVTGDYITFEEVTATPNDIKGDTSPIDDERWQVDGYCEYDDDRDDLKKAIRKALDRKSGMINGVHVEQIRYLNANGNFDDDGQKFRTSQDYKIRRYRS